MAEQAELQRQFPHTGYWFGMLPAHLDIPNHYQRTQYYPPPYHHNLPDFNPQHGQPQIPVPHPPSPLPFPPHVICAINNPAELPPLYQAVMGKAMAVPAARAEVSQVTLNVPLNTSVVNGGAITYVLLQLPTSLSFQDSFSRVCAKIDLEPATAKLGYKITRDPACTAAFCLMDKRDLHEAMHKMIEKMLKRL